ncbi:MAG: winged helix-turn-helix domain-containing protein [Burkholderiaceae bacterium]
MTSDAPASGSPPPAAASTAPGRGECWVGDWRVTPASGQIARRGPDGDDEVQRLEPKAMALLLHLARRPGQLVGRDELRAALWPGLVVGEAALGQMVAQLRAALGDTARRPSHVEAVANEGYRLIAPVRRNAPSPGRRPRPSRRWLTARGLAAALAVAALVAGLTWLATTLAVKRPRPGTAGEPGALASIDTLPTVRVRPFDGVATPSRPAPVAQALADPLAADLVADLSKLPGLRVASGRSDADGAAARYTVSGTVQADGDRLRLDLVLADAAGGPPLWSGHDERPLAELFGAQDDLVRQLAAELPVHVGPAELARLAQRPTRQLAAYQQFAAARAALLARRRELNPWARQAYWSAIGLDPAYARAYAGVAMTYALDHQQGWTSDGPADLARALDLADTALKMRPDLPEVHWVLAFVRAQRQQHADALRDLDDALRLNPSYADAYALQAAIANHVGRPADALALLHTALRFNPDANALYYLQLGRAQHFLGDAESARTHLTHALQRDPQNLEARLYLAASFWQAGDRAAARWQVEEIRSLAPRFNATAWLAGYPMNDPAQTRRLREALIALGL